MRIPASLVSLALLLALSVAPPVQAQALRSHVGGRQKPGPVTIRGIATHARAHDFRLETASHGSYIVIISAPTEITEKGRPGHLTVKDGDHVGVRGFVSGRQIRAILVRIYPVKPKPYTLRGVIVQSHGTTLLVSTNGKTVQLRVDSHTTIRVGSAPGSVRDLAEGGSAQIRVQPSNRGLLALNVHIYRHEPPKRHVELQGTLTSVASGAIVLRSGSSTYHIGLDAQTVVYVGASRSSSQALHVGQTVAVHACCTGRPLTATSIHVRKVQIRRTTVLVRGQVLALSDRQMRLRTSRGTVTITLQPSTVYEIGTDRTSRSGVRQGDQVSVRVYSAGRSLTAERVHVRQSYRRPHTVIGVVVSVSRTGLVVTQRGKRVVVSVTSSTAVELNGRRAATISIRSGDRVRATGRQAGAQTIVATRVTAKRVPPKIESVRGVVTAIDHSTLVIVDDFGARHTVRLASGARMLLDGKPAPPAALFPGVRASARGYVSRGALVASTVTLTVKARHLDGRLIAVGRFTLQLRLSSGETSRIDLPPGLVALDGGARLGPDRLQPGAFLRVDGYVETSGAVRAASLRVLHPLLDFTAMVDQNSGGLMTVRTTSGERFRLRFSSSTEIATGSAHLELGRQDIPVGAPVHVQGRVRSDGTLTVDRIVVHLSSVELRGAVDSIAGDVLGVRVGTTDVRVRAGPSTTLAQGSHPIDLSDLVPGDDISVYGYSAGKSLVLARKILVHRRLMGLDGTVTSIAADGFMLTASDGDHRVIVGTSTLVTGGLISSLASGMSVHVTGYRRGDGAILATRIRIGKKR